jgi:penicillin-binding protein 1C
VGSIKLMGLKNGSRLKAAPGQRQIVVTLDAVGGSGTHYWLLDGQQPAGAGRTASQVFALTTAGPHAISVVDGAGHYDSVVFEVDRL